MKKEAKEYIKTRVAKIAEKNEFKYNNIRITSAKTRWGSCSSRKNLNFSFFLIGAPKQTIDYVIVHELAHLREMNHSKNFWQIVENIMPDYKEHKKWLKENGNKLLF
jgi:predicted metal-dependent hydrolase